MLTRTVRVLLVVGVIGLALAGCTPDLDTGALIGAARFASVDVERFNLSVPIVGPHICGRAVR